MTELGEAPDIIREVHHQVKNTLQVVCSLLRLEGRAVADPSMQKLIRRSEGRVQAMSLVYDTLYKAGVFLEVPLDRYVEGLAGQIVRGWVGAGHHLAVEYKLEPVIVSTKVAISCGLILNELLNSLRGNLGGSTLRVDVGVLNRGVFLEVAIDLPEADRSETEGISEQIIQALSRQYGGRVVRETAEWLRYRVELPVLGD